MIRPGIIGICALLWFASGNATAQTVELFDVIAAGENRYRLGRIDPHIVYTYPQAISTADQGAWFDIELQAVDQPATATAASGEIFWANEEHGFESKYSIQFNLDGPSNRVFFPAAQVDSRIKALRLDINPCDCLVTLAVPEWQANNDDQKHFYPSGLERYLELAYGQDIAIEDWVSFQLKQVSTGVFEFADWDPRIVNQTKLEVPLNVSAGIYFDLDYDLDHSIQKYELFWSTEKLGWSQLRSAHFALPNQPADGINKKIFIPFANLHSQQTLKRLRLDFEPCVNCRFVLHESRIVGFKEAEKYAQFIPERLYYVHTEKPPAGFIRNSFRNKITRDLAFFVFLSVVLLSILGYGGFLLTRSE